MKQRTVMAISTVLNPKVIVADEPTSALDVVVQRQVMQTLGRIQEGIGSAVVLIGHDMGLIAQFADLIGVMYAGRLVEFGPVDEMLLNPRHPYTRMLIESIPKLTVKGRLVGIPGLPPALLSLPPGCSFSPRCPYVFDRCRTEAPKSAAGRRRTGRGVPPLPGQRQPAAAAGQRRARPERTARGGRHHDGRHRGARSRRRGSGPRGRDGCPGGRMPSPVTARWA